MAGGDVGGRISKKMIPTGRSHPSPSDLAEPTYLWRKIYSQRGKTATPPEAKLLGLLLNRPQRKCFAFL